MGKVSGWKILVLIILTSLFVPTLTFAGQSLDTPVPPETEEKILFTSDRDGDFDIYIVNPDGTGLEQLTNGPENEGPGVLSPDGKYLAYFLAENGITSFRVLDLSTEAETILVSSALLDELGGARPAWSPDSNKIAFMKRVDRIGTDNIFAIFTVDRDGSNLTQVTFPVPNTIDAHYWPAWCGSDQIYFMSNKGLHFYWEIYKVDLQNGTRSKVIPMQNRPGEYTPTCSDDESKMAWTRFSGFRDDSLWVANADGSNPQAVPNLGQFQYTDTPDFSPDGSHIVFNYRKDGTFGEIWTVRPDGTDVSKVVGDGAFNLTPSWGVAIKNRFTSHTLEITVGPDASPNPVASAGSVNLSVTAEDNDTAHTLNYSWTADCGGVIGNGSFDNALTQNPVWTAPLNREGTDIDCTLRVTVDDGAEGLDATKSSTVTVQTVPPELDITPLTNLATSGEFGGPFTPGSVSYTATNIGGGQSSFTAVSDVTWLDLNVTGTVVLGINATSTVTATVNAGANTLGVGTHVGTVTIDHIEGASDTTRTVTLTVVDTTPPDFVLSMMKTQIEEEDDRLELVAMVSGLSDLVDPSPSIDIVVTPRIVGDEDDDDDDEDGAKFRVVKEGDKWNIWVRGLENHAFDINVTATDAQGNSASQSGTVLVVDDLDDEGEHDDDDEDDDKDKKKKKGKKHEKHKKHKKHDDD